MKLTDFSIQSIELTHDQALDLKQLVIDVIENYGIENFEDEKEIDVPNDDEEPLNVSVICKITTEFDGSFTRFDEVPEPERITNRSVYRLVIKITNEQGSAVEFKAIGKIVKEGEKFIHLTPIDIEQEVIKHFTI